MNKQRAHVVIRSMRWWEIPTVESIESQLFPSDPWSIEQWWRELASDHTHYWVLALETPDGGESGELVGYAGLSIQSPEGDVQTIAISPQHQGRGLGSQLLEHLLNHAHERRVSSIFLEVRSDNAPAIALYEKRGFERISKRSRYYPDGTDALIYRLAGSQLRHRESGGTSDD